MRLHIRLAVFNLAVVAVLVVAALVLAHGSLVLPEGLNESQRKAAFLYSLLALGTLAVFAGFLFARRVARPVVATAEALRRLASGRIRDCEPIAVTTTGETGDLIQAYNDVLATLRNIQRMARQISAGKLEIKLMMEGELGEAFRQMLAVLRELGEKARDVSQGNLTLAVGGQGVLSEAFRTMVESMRGLAGDVRQSAVQIATSSEEIVATAREHERGATMQSSAVEETRSTMESLLGSARQIADTAQGVLNYAEMTHKNNQSIAERIGHLAGHLDRIGEILEVIKDIADQSEMLALNASLEGTKAGDAGRGFSLVAAQMQRLSENVMVAVGDIKTLTTDIGETTLSTSNEIEEGARLATLATEAARKISLVTQQQRSGTEQVLQAMNDINTIARQTADGSKQSTVATEELTRLANKLQERAEGFHV